MFTLAIGFYSLRFVRTERCVFELRILRFETEKKNLKKYVTVVGVIISRAQNIENRGGWFFIHIVLIKMSNSATIESLCCTVIPRKRMGYITIV